MLSVSRDAARRQLEREILQDDHQVLLELLRNRNPLLRGFEDWGAVVAFMRLGTAPDAGNDVILLPIFQAHRADDDQRWRTILLVIFWPGLVSILSKRRHWDLEEDQLWSNIYWVFLETSCNVDPAKRNERLVQKVINDVNHRLHALYQREWRRADRETATDCEALIAASGVPNEARCAVKRLREEQAARSAMLEEHRAAGRLGEADFLLLVGTRVYGWSLAEYARNTGLNYETIKKRHQRAIKVVGGLPPSEP